MTPKEIILKYADEIAAAIVSGKSRTEALQKYAIDGVNLDSLRVAYSREFPSNEKFKNKIKTTNKAQFDLTSVLQSIQNRVDEKIAEHVDPFEEIVNSVEGKQLLTGLFNYVNEGKLKISEVREILNGEGVKVSPSQLKDVFAKLTSKQTERDNKAEQLDFHKNELETNQDVPVVPVAQLSLDTKPISDKKEYPSTERPVSPPASDDDL